MARATLTELINRISNDIQENTSGNITATLLNELLDYLTNNLYLPTDATVTVNATTGIKEFTFGTGLTVTVDGVAGTAAVSLSNPRPDDTGSNYNQVEILLISGNTLDSVATSDPTAFVVAKTNVALSRPSLVYNTGKWDIPLDEVSVSLNSVNPRASKFVVSGKITSDSTSNDGHVVVRLRDTTALLTGTTKAYSAGATSGASTVEVGFTMVGFTSLTNGQELFLEVAKDFPGTLVVESLLMEIEPLW
ncbi:hypothetical protein SIPHO076v1_p0059 [Vibrio phage PS34B.1]|nr:hypothetical protein SIPHO076v1_p0059 [Vibrio phage PS34B.1]